MGKYHKIEKMLEDELEKISSSGKLGTSSLEVGDKVAHFLKSIKTIEAMDEAYDGESYDAMMDDRNYSYARGRGSRAKRDSMGRYSSRGYMMRDGYSRDGIPMDKHGMMAELEEMKRKIEEMDE